MRSVPVGKEKPKKQAWPRRGGAASMLFGRSPRATRGVTHVVSTAEREEAPGEPWASARVAERTSWRTWALVRFGRRSEVHSRLDAANSIWKKIAGALS